jgi:hypothetical protein
MPAAPAEIVIAARREVDLTYAIIAGVDGAAAELARSLGAADGLAVAGMKSLLDLADFDPGIELFPDRSTNRPNKRPERLGILC